MRSIFHIDLNSFYASCEIIESGGKYNYDNRLAVTGNPDARCGIILAASYPAKKYGVRAGMTIKDAIDLCPGITFVKARFPLYFRMSNRVMSIIRDYSPIVERYGIDEAFLDYTGCERLLGPPVETAYAIKERIKRETGLTVSIGVSYNKLLAKMGSDYKKPDAVTVITPENFREMIWPLPVKDLIFVGRRTAQKLEKLGIKTIGDLASAPLTMLKDKFGVIGVTLWMNANGIDDQKVRSVQDPVKGIGNSSTLPNDALTAEEINVMLLVHSEQVAKRLREIQKACRTVQIHLKDSSLNVRQHQATLPFHTDLTEDIYYTAVRLAGEIWQGEKIRHIGVRVTGLTDTSDFEQLTLFPEEKREKQRQLNLCMDKIREKYGNNSVFRGAILAEGLQNSIWYEDVFMEKL